MPVVDKRGILAGIKVRDAMRRQVVRLFPETTLDAVIRATIKFKVNAVLILEGECPSGVISKTDLMGAYYAGLDLSTAAGEIMAGPALACGPDEPLEDALKRMKEHHVHRLYVCGTESEPVLGVLGYTDIVGLLYRFCRKCDKNLLRARTPDGAFFSDDHIRLYEVMTPSVIAHTADDTLFSVMEGLSANRLGAVLINNADNDPVGVVSKTDLILAYRHGICADSPAKKIMASPVRTCRSDDFLVKVIRRMVFSDVHRLFVHDCHKNRITGVISLTDAARVRSGSCRACISSRMITGHGA